MTRLQRKRAKGWRKPEGSKCVDRSSRWGNPFEVAEHGRAESVRLYREHLASMTPEDRGKLLAPLRTATALCCYCKPDEECHADVLLEYLDRSGEVTE